MVVRAGDNEKLKVRRGINWSLIHTAHESIFVKKIV